MELADFYVASVLSDATAAAPIGNATRVGTINDVDTISVTNLGNHAGIDSTSSQDSNYYSVLLEAGKIASKVTLGFTLTRNTAYSANYATTSLFQFVDSDGSTVHLTLRGQGDGSMILSLGNYTAAGTALATIDTGDIKNNPLYVYVEIVVVIDDTNGSILVAIDDVETVNETGLDTNNGGNGDIGEIRWSGTSGSGVAYSVDNIYILSDVGATLPDRLGPTRVQDDNNANAGDHDEWTNDSNQTDNWSYADGVDTTVDGELVAHAFNDIPDSAAGSGNVLAIKFSWLTTDLGDPGDGLIDLGVHGAGDTDVYYINDYQPALAGSSTQVIIQHDPDEGTGTDTPWAAGEPGRVAAEDAQILARSTIV